MEPVHSNSTVGNNKFKGIRRKKKGVRVPMATRYYRAALIVSKTRRILRMKSYWLYISSDNNKMRAWIRIIGDVYLS